MAGTESKEPTDTPLIAVDKNQPPHVGLSPLLAPLSYEIASSKRSSGRIWIFDAVQWIYGAIAVLVCTCFLTLVLMPPSHQKESQVAIARMDIGAFAVGLDAFQIDFGRYPTSAEGLAALTRAPNGISNWHGPYISKTTIPDDPWNHPYVYKSPSTKPNKAFDLSSLGPDGLPGTADDISN